MAIATINPATGTLLRQFDELTDEQLEQKLSAAAAAFDDYRRMSFAQRSAMMTRAADLLDAEADELGRLITTEMGKPYSAAVAEVHKCARGCRYFAVAAESLLADEPCPVPGAHVYTRYEPLGPVLGVMPWNFPFWQVFRFTAPTLMAGNPVLVKHASNVPQCALAIEDLLRRAGFPDGVFQVLLISSTRVEGVIADERVRAVALTGSEPAGRQVGAAAGKYLKPSVLELGGSDPFIVMPSADLDEAMSNAVTARTMNNGQSCINAKRFIVHTDIADTFTDRLVAAFNTLRVGDPMDPHTDIGPLASDDAVKMLDQQVRDTVAAGARVLTGGQPLDRDGSYYAPTVLVDIPDGSPAHREELFGPVAAVWRARDAQDAVRIANDSSFGLGGCAWTNDPDEQRLFIRGINSGLMFINKFTESTPEAPFGGTKNSGYGRELGHLGIRSFVNAKTVWVVTTDQPNGHGVE